jgi:hypothetical protein
LDVVREYRGEEPSPDEAAFRYVRWSDLDQLSERHHPTRNRWRRLKLAEFDGELPEHDDAYRFHRFYSTLKLSANLGDPDALILLRDADSDEERRAAIRSLGNAYRNDKLVIVVGVPHPETECWLLAGYVHGISEEEERELEQYTRDTDGVDPCRQSHRLNATNESEKRHPKRALRELCPTEARQNQCLDASFDTLRRHGQLNGLAEFLDALESRLIPRLFGGTPPTRY